MPKRPIPRRSWRPEFLKYKPIAFQGYWAWAFQIAIRRSCWSTILSINNVKPSLRYRLESTGKDWDDRSANKQTTEINETIRHMSNIDAAVNMITSEPIISWPILEQYGLDESNFWDLADLLDKSMHSSNPILSLAFGLC